MSSTSFAVAGVLSLAALLLSTARARAEAVKPFELIDGDRVVFVGGTFFDREAQLGYIETALTSQFPDRNITFRNLGYGGDTVRCEGRTVCEGWANFGPPEEGPDKLRSLVTELKPTVVFISYGMGESFEGEAKLPEFIADYKKLMDLIVSAAGGSVRFVLIGPNFHEDLGRPLPDPQQHNRVLKLYSDAIRQIAVERSARFVDLYAVTASHQSGIYEPPLTADGIHLTPHGYWTITRSILTSLGEPNTQWRVEIDATGKLVSATGVDAEKVEVTGSKIEFTATSKTLPQCANPLPSTLATAGVHYLQARGLTGGTHVLLADGRRVASADADYWENKGSLAQGPDHDQAELLRMAIVNKNTLFFNSWRHENDTYILGYRKHEQGRNAPELKDFAALAAEKDKEIAKLRVPRPVKYTLEKTSDAGK